MRRKNIGCIQAFWNWMRKMLTDKCGEFPFCEGKPENERCDESNEREIVINNIKIHVRSIFTGKTSLDRAMKNIVVRKISDSKADQ